MTNLDIKRCKTCKHWTQFESEYGGIPRAGKCKAVPQFWDTTEWDDRGHRRILKPKYVGKLAFVQDASDYYAELLTLPEFGCVQHDENDQ